MTGSIPPAPIAAAMAASTRSAEWTLIGMSADGQRLFINYSIGDPCSESAGILVEETSDTVTVTATTRVVKRASDCESVMRKANGYVDLRQPLGKRALIHASEARTPDNP
ncbi:hypothetical protein [Pedococcus cremeus]|uniref:hypothetical protein n=1 Tax=Pedococcus cremeus TaxID=587636 RepID=UPI001C4353E0|nr:hypothetical protein [Pedococcus cremeus]